ncbi:MAG: hypothetical protein WHV67_01465 [Thermoanaerobaculia bacterium]
MREYALAGQSTIYLAMNPDGTRADNINLGNIIHIFDSATPYEGDHDIACVKYLEEDVTNKRVRIDLGEESDCNSSCSLNHNYDADNDNNQGGNDPWDFSSGNSAGVCKNDNLFFIADTSDLGQPFSDGFVTFHISRDGFEGSNVVPYICNYL